MNHIEEIGRYLTDQYLGGRRHRLKSMVLIKDNPYIIEDLTGYLESASELILSKVNWDGTRYCTKMTSLSIDIGKGDLRAHWSSLPGKCRGLHPHG